MNWGDDTVARARTSALRCGSFVVSGIRRALIVLIVSIAGAAPAAAVPAAQPSPDAAQAQESLTTVEGPGVSVASLGPDGAAAPYVYWTVTDPSGALVGGGSFTLQGPRSNAAGDDDADNQWNSGTVTLEDCTSAPCSGPDRDADPGEFLVTSINGPAIRADRRYRVRQETAPHGYQLTDGNRDYRKIAGDRRVPASGTWQDQTYGFGTFKVSRLIGVPMSCADDAFYSVQSNGTVQQVRNGTVTTFGSWGAGLSGVNGLGIGESGSIAWAFERARDNNQDIVSILRYDAITGIWERLPNTSYTTDAILTAGAVNPGNGLYLLGGFTATGTLRLYEFDPVRYPAGPAGALRLLGSVDTGSGSATGDMAFDLAGNLYIVRNTDVIDVIKLDAATLAAANGGALTGPVTRSAAASGQAGIDGMALAGDTSLLLGTATTVKRYDASSLLWQADATGALTDSTDLASCASVAALTVVTDVVARVSPADQFTLTAAAGTTTLGTATTAGSQPGVQAQRVGPIRVRAGGMYSIAAQLSAGSSSGLWNYSTSYACLSEGTVLSSGNGNSAQVTIPDSAGAGVVCTFTNSPLVAKVSTNAIIQDAQGVTPVPGVGWTTHARVTPTAGSATQSPAAAGQQTDANGAATWRLDFDATSSRASLQVSVTQQDGYDFVAAQCTVTALNGQTRLSTIADGAGTTLTGIAPGDDVQCSFTSRARAATLTLAAAVSFGTADPSGWLLTASGPSDAAAGPAGPTGSASATAAVTPGVAYTLAASGGPLTYLPGPWGCVVAGTGERLPVADATVTLAPGQDVTCTQGYATARLTLLVHVVGGGAGADSWELTADPGDLAGGALDPMTVAGSGLISDEVTLEVRPGHPYTISAAPRTSSPAIAYRSAGLQRLTNPLAPVAEWTWQDTTGEPITAAAGQQAVYRLVFEPLPAIVLPLTGGSAADTYQLTGAATVLLALLLGLARHGRDRARQPRPGRQ